MVDHELSRVALFTRLVGLVVRPPEVVVNVDQRGHDGLPGQIDAGRAGRRLNLALPADPGESVVLHQERGILDRRALTTRNEPSALEQDRAARRAGLLRRQSPRTPSRRTAT